jgi:hypothetical protein
MIYKLTIAGQKTEVAWTQETAKRYSFRASKLGLDPFRLMATPAKREYALICILWLVLPQEIHLQFTTPEDLHVAINHDNEAEKQSITDALSGIIGDMFPNAEKKSSGTRKPSRK